MSLLRWTLTSVKSIEQDALGRRINKQVFNSGALNTIAPGDYFYYDGHRLIEHSKKITGSPPPPPPPGGTTSKLVLGAENAPPSKYPSVSVAGVPSQPSPDADPSRDGEGAVPGRRGVALVPVGAVRPSDASLAPADEIDGEGTADTAVAHIVPGTGTTDSGLDRKDAVRMNAGPPPPPPAHYVTWREYVYGPEHVDDLVAEIDTPNALYYPILQDVNHNVVAVVDLSTSAHVEHNFTPYGEWASLNYVVPGGPGVITYPADGNDDLNEAPWTQRGFQGYYYDAEVGFWHARGRPYSGPLGRFVAADPIGTGLALVTLPSYQGMSIGPSAWVRPRSQ